MPTGNQAFPNGPVALSGNATDNVGVSSVQVAIRNRTTLQWRQANGTWGATFVWLNGSVLGSPGGTSTTWTYNWTPPAGAAPYVVGVRATDSTGNLDTTPQWVNFSVTA